MSLTVNGFNAIKSGRTGLNQAIVNSFHSDCIHEMLQGE